MSDEMNKDLTDVNGVLKEETFENAAECTAENAEKCNADNAAPTQSAAAERPEYPACAVEDDEDTAEAKADASDAPAPDGASENPDDERRRKMMQYAGSSDPQNMMCVYAGPGYFNQNPPMMFVYAGPGAMPKSSKPGMMLVYAAPPLPKVPGGTVPMTDGEGESKEKMVFCAYCGAQIPLKSKYCMNCGALNILYGKGDIKTC